MHFSKTYAQILEDLPVELQKNAIQYRQLKKLINQVVLELSSLGLSPQVLQDLIVSESTLSGEKISGGAGTATLTEVSDTDGANSTASADRASDNAVSLTSAPPPLTLRLEDLGPLNAVIHNARVKYEVIGSSDRIEPHLRLWVTIPDTDLEPISSNSPSPSTSFSDSDGSTVVAEQNIVEDKGQRVDEFKEADASGDGSGSEWDEVEEESIEGESPNVLWSLREKLEHPSEDDLSTTTIDSPESEPLPLPATDSPVHEAPPSDTPDPTTPEIPRLSIPNGTPTRTHEVIVPLVSDTKFFKNLSSALESMSAHLSVVHSDFQQSLEKLSRTIAATALPASASPTFRPHSALTSHAGRAQVSDYQTAKSDLYSWREIFQLYVDTQVFEHIGEIKGGERSIEESERRLKLFVDQATQRGLADRRNFKLKHSREALETFIEMNLFILNIKKFSEASSEATRKILKKHTKRTALPLPFPSSTAIARRSMNSPTSASNFPLSTSPLLLFSSLGKTSFPRTLVQALGQTLLPIIPHIDDYACLICTSIAFKPIRLNCGHLFCVRCLVKMQKSGKGRCPCCRRNSVQEANGSNVDWALLNFMQDWFPIEAREKLKANEKEAAEEEMREMGLDPDKACVIM